MCSNTAADLGKRFQQKSYEIEARFAAGTKANKQLGQLCAGAKSARCAGKGGVERKQRSVCHGRGHARLGEKGAASYISLLGAYLHRLRHKFLVIWCVPKRRAASYQTGRYTQ